MYGTMTINKEGGKASKGSSKPGRLQRQLREPQRQLRRPQRRMLMALRLLKAVKIAVGKTSKPAERTLEPAMRASELSE